MTGAPYTPAVPKRRKKESAKKPGNELGFEARLFRAADALRNNVSAAEYKHVVLGLLFLKYISDAFERRYADLEADRGTGANPEDPDEYRATSVYWVPKEVRWSVIHAAARQPTIGQLIDDAMVALERDNSALKETLPKDYARATVDKSRLGKLVDLVSDIGLGERRRSLELHARARLRILPLGIR